MWDWVWHRYDGLEPKHALSITLHHSSLIWSFPSSILHIVETLAVCLPDVNLNALDRLPSGILDRT